MRYSVYLWREKDIVDYGDYAFQVDLDNNCPNLAEFGECIFESEDEEEALLNTDIPTECGEIVCIWDAEEHIWFN